MPIFDYNCSSCKKNKEVLQKSGDPPPTCSACQKTMKRELSAPSFHLKGGGWYKDHYGLKTAKGEK